MFQGTLQREVLQKINSCILERKDKITDIYVGCSGNFTIERSLSKLGIRLHSNDVSLYSTILGNYFAGKDTDVHPSEYAVSLISNIDEYMKTPLDKVALSLCLMSISNVLNPKCQYHEEVRNAYLKDLEEHHKATADKVSAMKLSLSSYSCRDVVDYINDIEDISSSLICLYPPTYKGGYEKMFNEFNALFEWNPPEYQIYNPSDTPKFLESKQNANMFLVWDNRIDGRQEIFQSVSPGKKTVYLYANRAYESSFSKRVLNVTKLNHVLYFEDEIPDDAEIRFERIDIGEFNCLRAMYLSSLIVQRNPTFCFAVLVNGKLIGAIGISQTDMKFATRYNQYTPDYYLFSDFCINSNIKKLSKLILYVVMSKEFTSVVQSLLGTRVISVSTTIFTKRDMSMKYRGLFECVSKKVSEDGTIVCQYVARVNQWTLKEALKLWKEKYGGK